MYGTPPATGGEPRTTGRPPLQTATELLALRPEHLEHCLALDQRSLDGLWSSSQWATELAAPLRPGLGLWQQGELRAMACGWLILEELHITLVAVDPGQRRQGLGRQVLQALLDDGRSRGAERATLEVASGNTAARALYADAGFLSAGCRRGYYRNGDDALIQWLKLSA
jgi:ribosomal-protein-alanine N-acetyltransferase